MKTILCLHALLPNHRATTFQHAYAFPRYGPGNLYLFHHLKAPITDALKRIQFDGVIFHYCFLGQRAARDLEIHKERYSFLAASPATKIAICQDDYTSNEKLDAWLDQLGVNIVFSPITRDLEALYPRMFRKPGVEFREGLTGYVDDHMLEGIEEFTLPLVERPIDVGNRVKSHPPHLGRHAQKKAIVAQRFCDAASSAGFVTDCSSDPADVLLGNDWIRFLGSCRATIGCRGGASAADADGSTKAKCLAFLKGHPDASYDEVKAACFPDTIDTYRFDAISPRLFETAATRTCQVLVKDDYLGLEPYEDYIPLEEDFSNLPEVFEMLRSQESLIRLADNAHRKLIASRRFSYESFVRDVLDLVPALDERTQDTFDLIAQHFRELRPFTVLEDELGSVVAQAIKRAALRHLRNEPDMERVPHRSAIAALIEPNTFPRYPESAIQFQTVSGWATERGVALGQFFAALPAAFPVSPFTKTNLEAWGFCECIFDDS